MKKLMIQGLPAVERRALSIEAAAESIGLSPWTVRKYIADKKIIPTRIGRRVLIEPSEIERLLEAGRAKAVVEGDK
jgi:excisionase family DNA binding protein